MTHDAAKRPNTASEEAPIANELHDVTVLLLTQGRGNGLHRLLGRLSVVPGLLGQTLVLVNGAAPAAVEVARSRFSQARWIDLAQNRGVPYARNLGALLSQTEFVVYLDDDGMVDPRVLVPLVRCLAVEPTLAAVGLSVVESSELLSVPVARVQDPSAAGSPPIRVEPAQTFAGGAVAVRRSAFISVGLYPAHFFFGLEEDDLAFRLFRVGYRVAMCSSLEFAHPRFRKAAGSSDRARHYYRNRIALHWRNLPWEYAVLETGATLLGGGLRTLGTRCFKGFTSGTIEALGDIGNTIRYERRPLSRSQYRAFRRIDGRSRPTLRLRQLGRDVCHGKRLGWL